MEGGKKCKISAQQHQTVLAIGQKHSTGPVYDFQGKNELNATRY